MNHEDVQNELKNISEPEIAQHSQRFFKTGPGEYGENDIFLGIRVPDVRKVAKKFSELSLKETEQLLHSEYHESRLCALIILVSKCKKGDEGLRKKIYELYLRNTGYINNWDLVDTSAEHIVGSYLMDRDRKVLYQLAKSNSLWERRIAIMSTFHFIKNNDFRDTLLIAEELLYDTHNLIHKAVGWMLREVGNKDLEKEEMFLQKHIQKMPRTMLRYAIEKFPEEKRQKYLAM